MQPFRSFCRPTICQVTDSFPEPSSRLARKTVDHERYLPLAPRDLLILSVLAEGPLHGYGIIKAVEDRSEAGVFLDPANLYRALRRMRRVGWIQEIGVVANDRRKAYRITTTGRSVLAAELNRLERLLRHARPLLAEGPEAPGSGRGG